VTEDSRSDTEVRWLRRRLLAWGRTHYRDFPWRQDRDLYRSLVTEILLKQTRAEGVEPVRLKLLSTYPSAKSMAHALPSDIEIHIRKLGFGKQRAVQLHALGHALEDASIPRRPNQLVELPGIGSYAAAAISCFVFGHREIALDVNVARIISRVFDLLPLSGELRKNRKIIQVGQTIISGPRPRDLNWALLDLGALVCRPRPKCNACPLSLRCSYAIQAGGARHKAPSQIVGSSNV
jgi:A/G-specific adenine glycosylase